MVERAVALRLVEGCEGTVGTTEYNQDDAIFLFFYAPFFFWFLKTEGKSRIFLRFSEAIALVFLSEKSRCF